MVTSTEKVNVAVAPSLSVTVITIFEITPTSALPKDLVPKTSPVEPLISIQSGLLARVKVCVSPLSTSTIVGVNDVKLLSCATLLVGIASIVGLSFTFVTPISKVILLSPTLFDATITIPIALPISLLLGVPVNFPFSVLKISQSGLLIIDHCSTLPPATKSTVGLKL